ncbi:hypothetical protein LP7551_02092 [Roseibium album]|nr:hypothetical protein LP7551_02092 [Roseibium album]
MTHFVERNSIDTIEAGGADETAQFLLKVWQDSDGVMPPSSALMAVSPHLVIFDDICAPGDSPEILFFGSETLFSSQFPEAEVIVEGNAKNLLQEEYRNLVCDGYQDALYGEPVFETVGTGSLLGPGKPEIMYERVILKFKKRIGSYLVSYTIKRSMKWLSETEGRQDRYIDFQQTPGHHLLSPAEYSNVSHQCAQP